MSALAMILAIWSLVANLDMSPVYFCWLNVVELYINPGDIEKADWFGLSLSDRDFTNAWTPAFTAE